MKKKTLVAEESNVIEDVESIMCPFKMHIRWNKKSPEIKCSCGDQTLAKNKLPFVAGASYLHFMSPHFTSTFTDRYVSPDLCRTLPTTPTFPSTMAVGDDDDDNWLSPGKRQYGCGFSLTVWLQERKYYGIKWASHSLTVFMLRWRIENLVGNHRVEWVAFNNAASNQPHVALCWLSYHALCNISADNASKST